MTISIQQKLGSVEGIRGLACLMVFLSHLSSTFAPTMHTGNIANARTPIDIALHSSPFAFLYSGAAAVGIFFVLSGFILSFCILNKGDAVKSAAGMTIKRYFRLMPPALGSCIVAYFALKYFNFDKSALGDWAQNYRISNPSFFDAVYNGTISSFLSGSAPYNWSLWTMKIEFFGSLSVFFLCCILPHVRFQKSLIAIFLLIPFFMNVKPGDEIYYAAFFSGVLIYKLDIKISNGIGLIILVAGLFFCGYHTNGIFYKNINSIVNVTINSKHIDNYTLFNNVGGFMVVFSVLRTKCISAFFSREAFVKMGALSFSVYVLHQPIMHITTPLLFNSARENGISYSMAALLSSLFTILVVYLISIPYQKYVDNFSVKVSNSIKNKVLL